MINIMDGDWYEDGVLVEAEDFNEIENGPFEISYEPAEEYGEGNNAGGYHE